MEYTTASLPDQAGPPAVRALVLRLQQDSQRTILVVPAPTMPSARLVHTLRYYLDRYGLPIEAVTETAVRAILQAQPAVLAGRLVQLPASHFLSGDTAQTFANRDGLIQALRQAGAWVHLLPRLQNWSVVTDQLAFRAVLACAESLHPAGYERLGAPAPLPATPVRRPEDNPNFVDPWLGKRSTWCGVPTAVRREA